MLLILQIGPLLQKTVESFRLVTPTTGNYVPPYKDPWSSLWLTSVQVHSSRVRYYRICYPTDEQLFSVRSPAAYFKAMNITIVCFTTSA